MRRGRAAAVCGRPRVVARRDIAGLGDCQLVVDGAAAAAAAAATAADAEGTRGPWAIVVGQVHSAVVPGVTIRVEATGRFDRDERRLGLVARSLEERVVGRVRAIFSAI